MTKIEYELGKIRPHKGGRGKKHGGNTFSVSTTREVEELARQLRERYSNADIYELGVRHLISQRK